MNTVVNGAEIRQHFTFTTRRLYLRPLIAADEVLYESLYSCERVMRFIGEPFTKGKCRDTFNRILVKQNTNNFSQLFLIVSDKLTAEKYGLCALPKLALTESEAEIGNMLLPAAQGKQIAEEATLGVVDKLQSLGTAKIFMHIDPNNRAAIKAAARVKFLPSEANQNIFFYTD